MASNRPNSLASRLSDAGVRRVSSLTILLVISVSIAASLLFPVSTSLSISRESKVYCPLQKQWVNRLPDVQQTLPSVRTDAYCASSQKVDKFASAFARNIANTSPLTQARVDDLFFSFAAGHAYYIAGLNQLPGTPDHRGQSIDRISGITASNGFIPYLTANAVVYPVEDDVEQSQTAAITQRSVFPIYASLDPSAPRAPPSV